jgi:hypothetical protein
VLEEFATHAGVTYAIFGSTPRSASRGATAFVMSRDNMSTWSPVPGFAASPTPAPAFNAIAVVGFWLNPYTGRLLAMTTNGFYNQEAFLTSTDSGADWTPLPRPPFPFAVYEIAVQQPFTDQPWRICGGDTSSVTIHGVQQNNNMDSLACTADDGAHWTTYHLNVPNDRGGVVANYTLVAISDDGSPLLTTPSGLERVASGSGAMQSLGQAPQGGTLLYAAGAGVGVLWSAPVGGYPDTDPQGRIFTASYA